jgi:hypothetical protein
MATSVEQSEEHLPVFELSYFDSITAHAHQVRSQQGKIFLRLANGGAFQWISLRIVSSAIPLKVKYKCLYKPKGSEADAVGEALEGDRCPQEDAAYIKKIAFMSKIYYRCWLASDQRPEELEQKSAGMFWCYNGQFCGTEEDHCWIAALEIKMPPLINWTQLSR